MSYSWINGHLISGITTSWPANQSDAKLLEGGVFLRPLKPVLYYDVALIGASNTAWNHTDIAVYSRTYFHACSRMPPWSYTYISLRGCLKPSKCYNRDHHNDVIKRKELQCFQRCEGGPLVTGGFPSQRGSNAGNFFDISLNKRLKKQSSGRWFGTPGCSKSIVSKRQTSFQCLQHMANCFNKHNKISPILSITHFKIRFLILHQIAHGFDKLYLCHLFTNLLQSHRDIFSGNHLPYAQLSNHISNSKLRHFC